MMAARSRFQNHSNSNEWDSLREDFNNTTYEPQYPDEEASGVVQLDHKRLYITNIPNVLNEEGLRTAFSKYGTLLEVHMSKDPNKKYALVSFETPGEAKLAMTKLNRTEPLRLNVNIAHKKRVPDNRNYEKEQQYTRRSNKEDTASVGSRSKSRKDLANGDKDAEDDIGGNEFELAPMDPDLELELEQIKLKQLELQEEQVRCKQRLLLLKTTKRASNVNTRCILPDGRIVVRNVSERNLDTRDTDASYGAGAGDSLKIPALQRLGSRACVSCGDDADAFCSRCGVTPYCSARCQRRDWTARHQAVCHNLARLASGRDVQDAADAVEPSIPPPAPLRRPHSPAKVCQEPVRQGRQETKRQDRQEPNRQEKQDDGFDRQNNKVFTAPGHTKQPQQRNNNNRRSGRSFNNNRDLNNSRDSNNSRDNNGYNNNKFDRPQSNNKENWDNRNTAVEPKQTIVQKSAPVIKPIPEPVAEPKPVTNTVASVKRPGNVGDVTPAKKIVPKNYILELLPIGAVALISVDAMTTSCASNARGFVCVCMHDQFSEEYEALCGPYGTECEEDHTTFQPTPGDVFSYLSPEDGAWYRARSLGRDKAALIDSSKTIELQKGDATKRLVGKYEDIPEFCCVLDAANIKVGDNLKCTILAKTADGHKVSLVDIETSASVGEGIVSRWLPVVEYPPPAAASQTPAIPEVARPDVTHNSKVLLADITAVDRAYVRPSDTAAVRDLDQILQDVYLCAARGTPLTQPPKKGDVVIGKFTDGCFYRALVKRTNVAQNKYLLEYIDFGNVEVAKLENLYPCPSEFNLTTKPTPVSMVRLQASCSNTLTPQAIEYLDKLKDNNVELILTIPSGTKTAPSGSAVNLVVVKSNESVNKTVEGFCTPEWKKMEEKGVDVVESPKLMFSSLSYAELPRRGCELQVLDASALSAGSLAARCAGLTHQLRALETLTQRMAEYCNSELGRRPYLPALEELCIAQCPPYTQWFRAVVIEHTPGEAEARVLYIDYGNIEKVPVSLLRKMLPEFVTLPALACHVEIADFPKPATEAQLSAALQHMRVSADSSTRARGRLLVRACERQEPGLYTVHAPLLIAAMMDL
ncbi:uncharacterized protein LOC128682009 isoform X3 [Plodia interpunctella]|uniref:uncharacterized protein LOC128682009 isoform X3 n=1 Tax=Plodia interpunctella TaxID=58824 RepID=UPI002367910F|nr:uncharacterized protein LOC128682009 isoform X3 [Plodia interpunctella]